MLPTRALKPDKMGHTRKEIPRLWECSRNRSTQALYCENNVRFLKPPGQSHKDFPISYGLEPSFSRQAKELAFCNEVTCAPCKTFQAAVSFCTGLHYSFSKKNVKMMISNLQDYLTNFNMTLERFAWEDSDACSYYSEDYNDRLENICENNGGRLLLKLLTCDMELLFQHFDTTEILEYLLKRQGKGVDELLDLVKSTIGFFPLSDQITFIYTLKVALSTDVHLNRINLDNRDLEILATLPLVYACYQNCYLDSWKYEQFDFNELEDPSSVPSFDAIAQVQLRDYQDGLSFNRGYKKQRNLNTLYSKLQDRQQWCVGKIDKANKYLKCKYFNPDYALLEDFLTIRLPDYCLNLSRQKDQSASKPFLKYCNFRDAKKACPNIHISKFYNSEVYSDLINWHNENPTTLLDRKNGSSSSLKSFEFLDPYRFKDPLTTSRHERIEANYLLCLLEAFHKISISKTFAGVDNYFFDGKLFFHAKIGLQETVLGLFQHPCMLEVHLFRHLWQNLQECECDEGEIQNHDLTAITKGVTFKFFTTRRLETKQDLSIIDIYIKVPSEKPLQFCECCDKLECLRGSSEDEDQDEWDDFLEPSKRAISPKINVVSSKYDKTGRSYWQNDKLGYLRWPKTNLIPYIALRKQKIDPARYNQDIEDSKVLNANREKVIGRIAQSKYWSESELPTPLELYSSEGSDYLNKPSSFYESEIFSGELTCRKSPNCYFRKFSRIRNSLFRRKPLLSKLIPSNYEKDFPPLPESSQVDDEKDPDCGSKTPSSLPSLESIDVSIAQLQQILMTRPDTPVPKDEIPIKVGSVLPEIAEAQTSSQESSSVESQSKCEPSQTEKQETDENSHELVSLKRENLFAEIEQFLTVLKERKPDCLQNKFLEDLTLDCYHFLYNYQKNSPTEKD